MMMADVLLLQGEITMDVKSGLDKSLKICIDKAGKSRHFPEARRSVFQTWQ